MAAMRRSLPLSYIALAWHGPTMDKPAFSPPFHRCSRQLAAAGFFALREWSRRSKRSSKATKRGSTAAISPLPAASRLSLPRKGEGVLLRCSSPLAGEDTKAWERSELAAVGEGEPRV